MEEIKSQSVGTVIDEKAIQNSVEQKSKELSQRVNQIIEGNLDELDKYMDIVRASFVNVEAVTDRDLEKIILELPTLLYYLLTFCQQLEIKKGIAVESSKYDENNNLLIVTGTVAEKQAKANNLSIDSKLVLLAYTSALNLVKNKINGAMEVLASAKKIQQKRLEEMKLTRMVGDTMGVATSF